MIHTAMKSTGTIITALRGVTNTISFELYVFDTSGTYFDNSLLRSTLEIRIYP